MQNFGTHFANITINGKPLGNMVKVDPWSISQGKLEIMVKDPSGTGYMKISVDDGVTTYAPWTFVANNARGSDDRKFIRDLIDAKELVDIVREEVDGHGVPIENGKFLIPKVQIFGTSETETGTPDEFTVECGLVKPVPL